MTAMTEGTEGMIAMTEAMTGEVMTATIEAMGGAETEVSA